MKYQNKRTGEIVNFTDDKYQEVIVNGGMVNKWTRVAEPTKQAEAPKEAVKESPKAVKPTVKKEAETDGED